MLTSYNENVTVVKDITSEDIQTLDHAFSDCTDLVVDVEAVDLSRKGDVSLVSIATRTHDEQILEAIANNKMLECLKMTEYYHAFCVNANVKEILVKNPGTFIGKGGSNIKALRHHTNTWATERRVQL